MALGYAWFDSYDSVGYVLTLHISPHTVCPYLPSAQFSRAPPPEAAPVHTRCHMPLALLALLVLGAA